MSALSSSNHVDRRALLTLEEANPEAAPRVLEQLVRAAEQAGASDIHLQMRPGEAQVSFRLDGVMVPATVLRSEVAVRVFGRIKFLAGLKTYQESLPQDGRIDRGEVAASNDLRVSTYPTVTGEKIVLRLFSESAVKPLGELGFPERVRSELEVFLLRQSGMLLLTGPAGSGKTTTIYACLRHLAELGGRHVITVEDPVEQIIPQIMQTEVNEARGLTFARAARHLLRQDPQVLVIGEIRDEETARIAVRAGLTGQTVISTLHAGSCRGVFQRLLSMCPEPSAVASGLELVLNQRLLRRLCPDCGGTGCERCLQTRYRGRIPVVEWFRVDEGLRERIREGGPEALEPVPNLEAAARALVQQGLTDEGEYRRLFGA